MTPSWTSRVKVGARDVGDGTRGLWRVTLEPATKIYGVSMSLGETVIIHLLHAFVTALIISGSIAGDPLVRSCFI